MANNKLAMGIIQGVATAAILGVLFAAVNTYWTVRSLNLQFEGLTKVVQALSERVDKISNYEYRSKNFRRNWTAEEEVGE